MYLCAPGVLLNLDEVATVRVPNDQTVIVILKGREEPQIYEGDLAKGVKAAIEDLARVGRNIPAPQVAHGFPPKD